MGLYDNPFVYIMLPLLLCLLLPVWLWAENREIPLKDHETDRRENRYKLPALDLIFCLCLAAAVGSLLRLYPGNPGVPGVDSSVFLYVGARMREGLQPYRDLFDHKGPILYLIEYIGMLMTPGRTTGVWLLECMHLFAAAFIALRICRLETKDGKSGYLAVLLAFGVCAWKVFQGGNFTEEYALPWISLGLWIFYRFFQTDEIHKHEIVCLGISFQIVLLLRVNMALPLAALVLLVMARFLKNGRINDLLICTVLFLLGMAAVTVPVLVWASHSGFLKDLWEDYILFNFLYTDRSSGAVGELLRLFARFLLVLWPGLAVSAAALIRKPRNLLMWINTSVFLVSVAAACMSGRFYYHYAIAVLPAIAMPAAAFFSLLEARIRRVYAPRKSDTFRPHSSSSGNWRRPPLKRVQVCSFVLAAAAALAYRAVSPGEWKDLTAAYYLEDHSQKTDNVLVLGNNVWCYLNADRKTDNPFFYQLPPLEISDTLYDRFIRELTADPPDLVLIPGDEAEREDINGRLRNIRAVFEEHPNTGYLHEIEEGLEAYIRIAGKEYDSDEQ